MTDLDFSGCSNMCLSISLMMRRAMMSSNQKIILTVFIAYLLFNVIVSIVYSKKAEPGQ